jgi:four helix bundle protein
LELAIEFYRDTKSLKFPTHLRDQYLRACSSVPLNLSEGSAKPTQADRRKYYFIALGSVRECQTILKLQGYGTSTFGQKADFLGACVYKLCRAVK